MKINIVIYCLWALAITLLNACNAKEECLRYERRPYPEQQEDTLLARQAPIYRDTLLKRFSETPIEGLNYKAYRAIYWDAFRNGKSIKIEANEYGCFLTVKCSGEVVKDYNCENYQTKITEEEWNRFDQIFVEFNFWTETKYKANRNVLDGYTILLEGNRPEAEACDVKPYKLVGRGSPMYDKMGALYQYIFEYTDQLIFRYKQIHQ